VYIKTLSEPFIENIKINHIEKYKDKVDWTHISKYQKLSHDFMIKYKDKIKWLYVALDPIDKIILLGKIKDESIGEKIIGDKNDTK
jgi:hypothetical protein